VPLAHPPGHAQVDFGEALGVIGGVRQKIHFFCMDLPQSDACFVQRAQSHIRGLIWWFYNDLKAYCADPTSRRRAELRARFDRIFLRRTCGFP